jgi:hypothetical protein
MVWELELPPLNGSGDFRDDLATKQPKSGLLTDSRPLGLPMGRQVLKAIP